MKKIFKILKNSTSNHLEYLFGVLLVLLVISVFLLALSFFNKNTIEHNYSNVKGKASVINAAIASLVTPEINPEKIFNSIQKIGSENADIKNIYVIAEYNEVERRFDVIGTLNNFEVQMGAYTPEGKTRSVMDYSIAGDGKSSITYASGTERILKTVSLIRNNGVEPSRIYIVSDLSYDTASYFSSSSFKKLSLISILVFLVIVLLLTKYLVYISNKNHIFVKNKDRNSLVLFAFREVRTSIKNIGDKIERIKDTERLSVGGNNTLQSLKEETKELSSLISNIVDTHNLEEGKMSLHYSSVNPTEILEDICRNMESEAKAKRLKLTCLSSPLPNIKVDRIRFKQIVQNLIHNAIKYTNEGSVTVSSRVVQDGRFVEIRVSDTGLGISMEKQKEIFNKYTKENNDDVKGVKSAGLGLFLVSELTQKMDGSISFESKENVGSDFVLKFKIQK